MFSPSSFLSLFLAHTPLWTPGKFRAGNDVISRHSGVLEAQSEAAAALRNRQVRKSRPPASDKREEMKGGGKKGRGTL